MTAAASATPFVTVVMPLHDKREFVRRAVESVLRQTHRDLALIVVDDGSTDGSGEVVAALSDPRLRCLRTARSGPGAARNTGIRASDSPWIALLDADDEWDECFLEKTLAAAAAAPAAVAIYSDVVAFGAMPPQRRLGSGLVTDYFGTRMDFGVAASSSSIVVRRAALLACGGFSEQGRYAEDIETWLRLSLQGPFYFVAEPLCAIEVDDGARLTRTVDHRERAAGLQRLLDSYDAARRAHRIDAAATGIRRFMEHQRGRQALHLACAGDRRAALSLLRRGVPLGAHTWREYLGCAARLFLPARAHRDATAPPS